MKNFRRSRKCCFPSKKIYSFLSWQIKWAINTLFKFRPEVTVGSVYFEFNPNSLGLTSGVPTEDLWGSEIILLFSALSDY